MEGAYTGFLCQIIGKRAQCILDGKWVTTALREVQEAEGMNLASSYIG